MIPEIVFVGIHSACDFPQSIFGILATLGKLNGFGGFLGNHIFSLETHFRPSVGFVVQRVQRP